ncbi:uncharacterized protein LOC131667469 [Phymastichus coffea]|uniref:uncharacterized protein LOC131667469 n=1 Tax=Phymastichus coffea TaxID=108790 RepID=UPI00273C0C8C|nr:uncharacterized protein LOC131667469 [Phymastichus coffea]
MKGLLLVLIFAVAKQNGILGKYINDQIALQQMIDQTSNIKMHINHIKDLGISLEKNLTNFLSKNITTKLENHIVVRIAEEYFNLSKQRGLLTAECESIYNLQYNKVKIDIYNQLYKKIVNYYRGVNIFLTTIIKEELEDFEKDEYQPIHANYLQEKINEAFNIIDLMKKGQHEIVNKTLNYFHEDESFKFLNNNLYLPFMRCFRKTLVF